MLINGIHIILIYIFLMLIQIYRNVWAYQFDYYNKYLYIIHAMMP